MQGTNCQAVINFLLVAVFTFLILEDRTFLAAYRFHFRLRTILYQLVSALEIYVTVPNKTDYFKLYVEKEMEVRPYAIYKQNKHTREYELYDVGAVSVLYKLSAYAKKV